MAALLHHLYIVIVIINDNMENGQYDYEQCISKSQYTLEREPEKHYL